MSAKRKSELDRLFAYYLRGLGKAMLDAADKLDPKPSEYISPELERSANKAYWVIVLNRSTESFFELPQEIQQLRHELFRERFPKA